MDVLLESYLQSLIWRINIDCLNHARMPLSTREIKVYWSIQKPCKVVYQLPLPAKQMSTTVSNLKLVIFLVKDFVVSPLSLVTQRQRCLFGVRWEENTEIRSLRKHYRLDAEKEKTVMKPYFGELQQWNTWNTGLQTHNKNKEHKINKESEMEDRISVSISFYLGGMQFLPSPR